MIERKFITQIRVRYSETDQMGYCYYGNYAQFLEIGRVEALRNSGFRYKEMEQQGILLPVLDFQIKYIFPAKYDDLLTIETTIVAIKGTRIIFDYEIINEMGVKIATASTTLVFVSKESMRPMKAPENIVKAIQNANK
jgi:acyl-CoA thioester hydrolase